MPTIGAVHNTIVELRAGYVAITRKAADPARYSAFFRSVGCRCWFLFSEPFQPGLGKIIWLLSDKSRFVWPPSGRNCFGVFGTGEGMTTAFSQAWKKHVALVRQELRICDLDGKKAYKMNFRRTGKIIWRPSGHGCCWGDGTSQIRTLEPCASG